MFSHPIRTVAAATLAALVAASIPVTGQGAPPTRTQWEQPAASDAFHRLSTFPVFENRPEGEPADAQNVAEISTVSEDGNTLIYTDAAARRIGFLDISDPARPQGQGTLSLRELGNAEDEPTSVAVIGDYVLVVVNTSVSYTQPSGRVDVIELATRKRVRSIDLGGQPDSIAVSSKGDHAAIAIENERDEEALPDTGAGEEGDLPQAPGGFVQLLDLSGDVDSWSATPVPLTQADGSALPELAGLDTPSDPEPEYVSISPSGERIAVTLQENNGILILDAASGRILSAFSAGTASVEGIDTEDDGQINQNGSIADAPREPDAIAWIDETHVATANEGDWKGGTRGWSVFNTETGEVTWDSGAELERLAVRTGLHVEGRADNKGIEAEGLAVASFGKRRLAFVGSERSNFVAVYDVTEPAAPRFQQVLATTNGPEGILPVPSRNLLMVSSEEDAAEDAVRATITAFGLGGKFTAQAGAPEFPSVVSADDAAGQPIGWTALGALSADPADPSRLWTAPDAAHSPSTLLSLRLNRRGPAELDSSIPVTQGGTPAALDIEGLWARPAGGFWLGVEGTEAEGNALVRTDATGAVVERVSLPQEVLAGLDKWGIEGVSGAVTENGEELFVALQRGLTNDAGLNAYARIGRYSVETGEWSWYAYPLEASSGAGDWIGLSEVTVVDADTLAVIERDKLNGPAAQLKRVTTVDLPATTAGEMPTLVKRTAIDVLPALRSTHGWTQEKLEGLTIGGNGRVYAVTDNDGADEATGETVLLDLGPARATLGGDGSLAR